MKRKPKKALAPLPDDISHLLSPRSLELMQWFIQFKRSHDAMRAAHPEVTEEEIAQVTRELLAIVSVDDDDAAPDFFAPAGKVKRKGKKKSVPTGVGYRLKITLRGSKPPIWRRVIVPADITLDRLHDVIQTAMGWYDSHLHAFDIGGVRFDYRRESAWALESEALDETQYRLGELVNREKAKFTYEYDFGDGWEHSILLEKIIPPILEPKMFTCTAGKNACPPEDCGGLWGFYQRLAALNDPDDEYHEETMEWMGEFDPEAFDRARVNAALARLR